MAKLACNHCHRGNTRRTTTGDGQQYRQRLYFNECGHILCDKCLAACHHDNGGLCVICRELVDNPILMETINKEDQLLVEDSRRSVMRASGGVPPEALDLRSSPPGLPTQLEIAERVTPVRVGDGGDDDCQCAVTSVSRNVTVRGREQFVDLSPTYEVCEPCRRKGMGGVDGGNGGGLAGLIGNIAVAAWNVILGK